MHNHKVKGTLKTFKIANNRSKTYTKPHIVSYDPTKTYENLYKNIWKYVRKYTRKQIHAQFLVLPSGQIIQA